MEEMNKIAVFFDAENVSSKRVPDILAWLSKQGEILFQRAYADWSIPTTKSWREQVSKTPITVFQQFHNNEAQVIDKAIMMDAIELSIKHSEINTIAIVASDKGYYSLSLRLRELGKKVIGIGEKQKCQPLWVHSCNLFQYFEDIEAIDEEILFDEKDIQDNNELANFSLLKFIDQAYDSTPSIEGKDIVSLSCLGESIRRFKSDFKLSDYKKSSLLALMKDFSDRYEITNDEKNPPTYFVKKIVPQKESEGQTRIKGIVVKQIKNFGIIQDKEKNEYFFYMKEILPGYKNRKVRKNCSVEFTVSRQPDPLADSAKERNGYATDIAILSAAKKEEETTENR